MKAVIVGILILIFAGPLKAKDKGATPHTGVVKSFVVKYDAYTDTTQCRDSLTGVHCTGRVSQDQHTYWYVFDQCGNVYEINVVFDHDNAAGFVEGDKLEYWVEKRKVTLGPMLWYLHVTNFKKPNGKQIKLLVTPVKPEDVKSPENEAKKAEVQRNRNRPVPVNP